MRSRAPGIMRKVGGPVYGSSSTTAPASAGSEAGVVVVEVSPPAAVSSTSAWVSGDDVGVVGPVAAVVIVTSPTSWVVPVVASLDVVDA
jgi:hypothetical protein